MATESSLDTRPGFAIRARLRLRGRLPRGRSDDALVAGVRAGDDRAFEVVFDRYHRGLLAFCGQMLGSREEAEDALQHTFMAAYRALRSSDDSIRLKAWLYTIARNRCLSALGARREQVAFDETHAPTDALAAELHRRAELLGLLADLERLPHDQRAALVLFELGDHGHDEIAEILGVRREKVKALVFQARESLASWRRARETPCTVIREQLATLRGAALKRATLRRHVVRCESCRDFEADVRRQRAAMALALPIGPTAGLKASVLSSVLGGGAGAVGLGTGASVAGLGAAKGLAAKTLLCAVVAGSAGSVGYVAVRDVDPTDRGDPVDAQVSHPAHARHARDARQPRTVRRSGAARPLAPARAVAVVPIAASAAAAPAASGRARGSHRWRRSAQLGRWARLHRRRPGHGEFARAAGERWPEHGQAHKARVRGVKRQRAAKRNGPAHRHWATAPGRGRAQRGGTHHGYAGREHGRGRGHGDE